MGGVKRVADARWKRALRGVIPALFWVAFWQAGAALVGREVLLPSPVQTLQSLWRLAGEAPFWHSLLYTFARVMGGYALAVACGVLLGALCAASRLADALLSPLRGILKATPVTSFIILVLLWLSGGVTPVFTAFIMVLPIIWSCVQTGVLQTDADLLEMARVYHVPFYRRVLYWYAPSVLPQFRAACATGVGFAWKSAVAAEVIAKPLLSVGKNLSDAKIYLNTSDLFAWTLTVIVLSLLIERTLGTLMGAHGVRAGAARAVRARAPARDNASALSASRVRVALKNVSVAYDGAPVLNRLSFALPPRGCVALSGPSGVGKTTLLRVIAGLRAPDAGDTSEDNLRLAVVFQEDRLLPWLTARGNIEAVMPPALRADAGKWLEWLEIDAPDALPGALSGGMRRRVALARALCARPELLLLDEPFTGLDDALRGRVIALTKNAAPLIVLVSHDAEDARLMDATVFALSVPNA